MLAGAGYKLRGNLGAFEEYIGSASNAVLVVLAAGYLWRGWRHRPDRED
jgi:hypothetical protein